MSTSKYSKRRGCAAEQLTVKQAIQLDQKLKKIAELRKGRDADQCAEIEVSIDDDPLAAPPAAAAAATAPAAAVPQVVQMLRRASELQQAVNALRENAAGAAVAVAPADAMGDEQGACASARRAASGSLRQGRALWPQIHRGPRRSLGALPGHWRAWATLLQRARLRFLCARAVYFMSVAGS